MAAICGQVRHLDCADDPYSKFTHTSATFAQVKVGTAVYNGSKSAVPLLIITFYPPEASQRHLEPAVSILCLSIRLSVWSSYRPGIYHHLMMLDTAIWSQSHREHPQRSPVAPTLHPASILYDEDVLLRPTTFT